MTDFARIIDAARTRAGGKEALEARLPVPSGPDALRARSDDRYLSLMALRIFRAGLKHSMVDAKWPAFEEAFLGFEPRRVTAMSDEAMDALLADKRLIRHGGKMMAVRENAGAMLALAEEAGSMGAYLADWPGEEIVGLWQDLAKRFKQLGGNSGPVFLRMAGKDSFILTPDVVRALQHWGTVESAPKGKRAQAQVQAAFNDWVADSQRPLSQISMILALSVN